MKLHVIPVPPGWSPEQSWEQISRGIDIPDEPEPFWSVVEVEGGVQIGDRWIGGKLVRLVPIDEEDQ